MLIVPIEEAEVGMSLAAPVPNPERPDQDLLKRGYVLEATVLRRLRDMQIGFVYVDYPGLDELDKHLEPLLSPARQAIYSQIKKTILAGQQHTRPAVGYQEYYGSTREMVLTLVSQGQHPIYLDQMSRLGTDAVGHATAVAHLSLLLGLKLERYLIESRKRLEPSHAKEVVNLGVAGMLHDMGKLRLPPGLQDYTSVERPEKEEDARQWETHSRLSYDLIHNGVEPSAACAVLHHHQHHDGSGFPSIKLTDGTMVHPSGSAIHIFARIVFAADLYDRLATSRTSKMRRPNLEILHRMRTEYAATLDPVVLAMVQSISPPFPPGMRLELDDGTSAIVTRVDPADPYRPTVKRLEKAGRAIEEGNVDLKQPGAPGIRAVGGVDVAPFLPQAAGVAA